MPSAEYCVSMMIRSIVRGGGEDDEDKEDKEEDDDDSNDEEDNDDDARTMKEVKKSSKYNDQTICMHTGFAKQYAHSSLCTLSMYAKETGRKCSHMMAVSSNCNSLH